MVCVRQALLALKENPSLALTGTETIYLHAPSNTGVTQAKVTNHSLMTCFTESMSVQVKLKPFDLSSQVRLIITFTHILNVNINSTHNYLLHLAVQTLSAKSGWAK